MSRLAAGIVLAVTAELASQGVVVGQAVTEMTPDSIREAAEWGRREKAVKPYKLKRTSKQFGICEFLTPYLRVAQAANLAAKENEPFVEAETADLVSAVVLHGRANASNEGNKYVAEDVVDLFAVKGGHEIRPTRTQREKEIFHGSSVSFKGTIEAYGMKAVFPADIVGPETEVVVIYRIYGQPQSLRSAFRFESKPYR